MLAVPIEQEYHRELLEEMLLYLVYKKVCTFCQLLKPTDIVKPTTIIINLYTITISLSSQICFLK